MNRLLCNPWSWSLLAGMMLLSSAHAQTLEQDLNRLDSLRNGTKTPLDKVEEEAQKLFKAYPTPTEHAEIYFMLAHIYGQSGVQRPDLIAKYAREALKQKLTPQQRGRLYTYLGSAAEGDETLPDFPARRRVAAHALLEGLDEITQFELPEVAPQPPVMVLENIDNPDPKAREETEKRMAEQMAVRKQIDFLGTMIDRRRVLLDQVSGLYARMPYAAEELKALTEQIIRDPKMQQRVMARLTTETAHAEEIEKERQRRFKIPSPVKAEEDQPDRPFLRYSIMIVTIIILIAISLVIIWRRFRKSE